MIIGVPREIKLQEFRVALTPEGVAEFVKNGHTVFVEQGTKIHAGFIFIGDHIEGNAPGAGIGAVFR